MGLIAIGLYFATGTAGLDLPDYSFIVLRVGAILAPIAACVFPCPTVYFGDTDYRRVFHLVIFVRACIHLHQRRREGKKLNYQISEDNRI